MNTSLGGQCDAKQGTQVLQVQDWMERCSGQINRLENVYGSLQGRLVSVLKSVNLPPTGCDEVECELVPLAHEIKVMADRIEAVGHYIEDTLGRLEL